MTVLEHVRIPLRRNRVAVRMQPRAMVAVTLAALIGIIAFIWPFVVAPGKFGSSYAPPLIFGALLILILAVVVAEGDLHVRASFTPETAVGVLREGQQAGMRFPGYPWPIYGTVAGTVTSVGTEPLSGMIAVELSLQQEASSWIKLQHGLPAEVEVQVDRVSPATLVLRAIGHATAFSRAAPPAEAKP